MPTSYLELLLEVSESFISKWQQLYRQQGINALKLGYWGTQGYLDEADKQAVIEWLRQRQTCQLEELILTLSLPMKWSSSPNRATTTCCIKPDSHGRRPRRSVPRRMTSKSPKKTRDYGVTHEVAK